MTGPDRKPRLCDHTAPVPSLCAVDMLASVYQNHRGVLLEKKTQLCLLTGWVALGKFFNTSGPQSPHS